jgi:hypothetical protein
MNLGGRQNTLLLWTIGAFGALLALGIIGVVAWLLFFNKPAEPIVTPTATPLVATPQAQAADTSTPVYVLATDTATPRLPPTATAGAPIVPTLTLIPPITATLPAASPTVPPLTLVPTASITPIPSATAPAAPYGTVIVGAANVRQGPGEAYPVIAQATNGQTLLLLGQSAYPGWFYAQLPDGRIGWIASALVSAPVGVSLPIVAAPPLIPTPIPTYIWPTPYPTPWPTFVWPTPIPSPWPTFVWPTPIPTPWPTFVWPTPVPTLPPPPPPPPTSTFTPAPPCPIPVAGPFIGVWSGSVRGELGCPVETVHETWTAVERFERGVMLWREDQRMIYVLANDGTWRKIADTWIEGMPQYACSDVPPAGLVKPQRGFGLVWCTTPGMKSLVGWALEEEHGITTQYQSFQNGEMIRAEDSSIYVLLRSGWWRRY